MAEHFTVIKEKQKYGTLIYLQREGSNSSFVGDRYYTREEHKKFWKNKDGKRLIKDEDFQTEVFPNIGDGYFDSDYATPIGYKCVDEYK